MTHIYQNIRLDALKYLNLWMTQFGPLFLSHASELLTHYVAMISESQSTTLVSRAKDANIATNTMRNAIFQSLIQFLTLWQCDALGSPKCSMPATRTTGPLVQVLFQPEQQASGYDLHNPLHVLQLLEALSPSLVTMWIESAPTVFEKATVKSSKALEICHTIIQLMVTFLRCLPTSLDLPDATWKSTFYSSTLRHFVQYFPFDLSRQIDPSVRFIG